MRLTYRFSHHSIPFASFFTVIYTSTGWHTLCNSGSSTSLPVTTPWHVQPDADPPQTRLAPLWEHVSAPTDRSCSDDPSQATRQSEERWRRYVHDVFRLSPDTKEIRPSRPATDQRPQHRDHRKSRSASAKLDRRPRLRLSPVRPRRRLFQQRFLQPQHVSLLTDHCAV